MTIKKPQIHNKTLWNGWTQMPDVWGVIIHNDYGRMSALDYENWLTGRDPELGLAHYYIDRNTIARYVDTFNAAYHAGDSHGNGNAHYIGYEVVQSRGTEFGDITQSQFLENEDMTLRQAAEDLQFYGLEPNTKTVKLHNQFTSTSCPHLSQDIHGYDSAVQTYFISRIAYFISKGKTVSEMIDKENKSPQTNTKQNPVKNDYGNAGIVESYREIGGSGLFTVDAQPEGSILVRDIPSTKGKHIATYYNGDAPVKYHTLHKGNGYVWLEYAREVGGSGFIPCRTYENGVLGELWGEIE